MNIAETQTVEGIGHPCWRKKDETIRRHVTATMKDQEDGLEAIPESQRGNCHMPPGRHIKRYSNVYQNGWRQEYMTPAKRKSEQRNG